MPGIGGIDSLAQVFDNRHFRTLLLIIDIPAQQSRMILDPFNDFDSNSRRIVERTEMLQCRFFMGILVFE